jgi:hypothetical protein
MSKDHELLAPATAVAKDADERYCRVGRRRRGNVAIILSLFDTQNMQYKPGEADDTGSPVVLE